MPPTILQQRHWVPPTRGIRYPLQTPQPPPPPIPPSNVAPPVTAAWVTQRGIRNQQRMAQMQVPYAYMFASDAVAGTLIFGGSGTDWLAQQGPPPQQQQAWVLRRGVMNRPQAAAMQVRYAYNFAADAAAGNLVFGGSSTEGKTGSDSPTGTLIWGGSRTESATFSQTASGTIIFSGSASETYSPPTQPFTWTQVGAFIRVS